MAQDQVQGLLFNRLFGQKTDGPVGLLGNPMLQVGMGLLASRANPRINPFEAAMTGLTNAAQFRQIEEDRKREMEMREREDKVREHLSKIIPGMFSTRVEGPPTPDGVAPTQISPMGQALGEVAQVDPLGAFDVLTRMQTAGSDIPVDIQTFDYLNRVAKEDTPEGRAARIRLRLEPGASAESSYAMRFFTRPGPDGRERQYMADPASGNLFILSDDGSQWLPVGSQQAGVEPAPQPSGQQQSFRPGVDLLPGQPGSSAPPSRVVTGAGPGLSPAERAAQEAEAKAKVEASTIPPARRAELQDKVMKAQQLLTEVDAVQAAFDKIKSTLSAGPYGMNFMPNEAAAEFDKAVARLAPLKRQITRVPGEGSMSDYEQRLEQATLPDRGTFENVTQQQIDAYREMAQQIINGYAPILNGNQAGAAAVPDDEYERMKAELLRGQ